MKKRHPNFVFIFVIIVLVMASVYFFLRAAPPQQLFQKTVTTLSPSIVTIVWLEGILGTGTLVDENTVLTSKHILTMGNRYGVRFSDASLEWSQVSAIHPTLDIALLSLEKPHKGEYPIISLQKPTAGVSVVALGTESDDFSLVQLPWTLLALDSSTIIGGMTYSGLILSDISLQSWYSGWPLLNSEGEIIGVHTAYEPAGKTGWSTLVTREIIRELHNGRLAE